MTTPSLFQQTGLSVSVFEPLIRGGRHLFDLREKYSGLRFTVQAMGGYWDGSLDIEGDENDLGDWLESGLDRNVVIYNEAGETIFEGFVNETTIVSGGMTLKRGPVMDLANLVILWYSTIDTSITPPAVGVRRASAAGNDLASQARYGVREKILSTGGVNDAEVDQVRDLFLGERAYPKSTHSGGERSSEPKLTVDLLGHVHRFQSYRYNSALTGDQNLSTKLLAVLAADPDGIFSTFYGHIAANVTQVAAWENDNRLAWDVIKELAGKGDASNARYLFGVYADRVCRYEAAPTVDDFAYERRITDRRDAITTPQGGEVVFPWNVKPGRYMFHPDFLPGRHFDGPDPRKAFLESWSFTAPWGFSWNGGNTDRLPQKLARLGIMGLGE